MSVSVAYSQNPASTVIARLPLLDGRTFVLTPETAAGADVMRLTGDQDVRIDFTNPANQIKGLDLNGNGVIANDGVENAITGKAANFEIVDAYARNPLNEFDKTHNFLGDIRYDGTGYGGDGVNTDGNIVLGGLGADAIFGGIGNDFLAGGGVAPTRPGGGADYLSGGRNTDFFFGELSALDPTDGNGTTYDGGTTTDDSAAGLAVAFSGVNSQNNDWLLIEASDDNEPTTIVLQGSGSGVVGAVGSVVVSSGTVGATLRDIESVDASGNLYGHLNDVEVKLGGRAVDLRSTAPTTGTENYGIGSSAQLNITGSDAANVIVGGYDNDVIDGGAGNDILFGGNLKYLMTNRNNPNLLDASGGLNLNVANGVVTDGRDDLSGGSGNDSIVFEMNSGTIAGGSDTGTTSADKRKVTGDTAYLTDFSMGRLQGATTAGESTAQQDALNQVTTDKVVRFDLGNDGAANFKNYGGSNATSQDATNYTAPQVVVGVAGTVTGIESVIATGLGRIDYKAAGSNSPELTFNNQQNYLAINANLDLRGSGVDNTLYASTGNDSIEGRGGDDNLSGGAGDDKFIFAFGDGVDAVHRQKDANGDNLWDDTNATTGVGSFVQDFRAPQAGDISSSRLTVDFGSTDLTSVDVQVALFNLKIGGVAFTVPDTAALAAAKSATALAAVVNSAYHTQDAQVSVVAVGNTLVVTDKSGRDISDTVAEGYGVGVILGSGAASTTPTFTPGGTPINVVENDIIVIKTYDNRAINLGANELSTEISNAAALVTRLDSSGSQLAQAQNMLIKLTDVSEGDKVTVTINGKEYSYTALSGENSEAVSAKLVAVINNELDLNSGSGRVVATNNTEVAEFDEADTTAGVQDVLGNIAVFSVTQAIVGGSQTYMNTSVTVTNALTGSAAGNAAIHNQSNTHIDLLGFDGRNGNLNGSDVLFLGRSATSVSRLQTAKDTGETLAGTNATLDADTPNTWINGDDLLIGGNGNDIINAGTGDDRILVSRGTDSVSGGGNTTNADLSIFKYNDVLQAEESTFATGTRFKTTLDGTLGETGQGKGVLLAQDGVGATIGTTTFDGIETVRMLENSRASSLDVETLSNNVAIAVGANVITGTEGLTVNLTRVTPSVSYTIDGNNSGSITIVPGGFDKATGDYSGYVVTQVYGEENVTTGNANDTVNIDASQIGANNTISLGNQQDNTTTFAEGEDLVAYTHTVAAGTALALPKDAPNLTVKVESAANTDEISMTGGVLGSTVTKDTLISAERIDVSAAANHTKLPLDVVDVSDVLDVSAIAGATIGFGTAQTVYKSMGGGNAVTSVASLEANTLETGGVSKSGNGFGNETLEITGITQLEIVTGSASDDRVIVGDAGAGTAFNAQLVDTKVALNRVSVAGSAEGLNVQNAGLIKFNLGDGTNDTVDYFNAADDIAVSVDTSGAGKHYVLVDATAGGGFGFTDDVADRVDFVTGVERFFATDTSLSAIDLSAATMDTTIQFSKESLAALNEYAEPNGNNTVVTTDLVRGIEVRDSTAGTVFARFMERTGSNAAGDAYWTQVQGSDFAETVVMTDNETAAPQTMNLMAGANLVDYSARSASVTLAVQGAVAGTPVTQAVTVDGDTINVTASSYASGVKTLTVKGSSQNSDVVSVAALTTDIDSYNLVDLAAGVAVEDVLSADRPTNIQGTAIYFAGFENIAGSASVDRLYGNGSINAIAGNGGNDWIVGRGGYTSGVAPTVVGGGDILTGGGGNDRFVFENESDSATVIAVAGGFNDSQDNIVDFTAGDLLVFNTSDAGAVKLAAAASVFTDGGAAANSQMQIDQNGNGALNTTAAEILADHDYTFYDTTGNADETAILMRVAQSSGQDIQYLNKSVNAVDAQFEVVYTSAAQSNNLALPDEFHGFNLDRDGVAMVGADKIDLRSFNFGAIRASEDDVVNAAGVVVAGGDGIADSIQAILYSEPATVNSITNVANFFREGALTTGVERVINIQRESGTTNFRVFVDVNRDGNYTQTDDLVFDIRDPQNNSGTPMILSDATSATTFFNDANADGVPDAAGSANIFIFNDAQYKLWEGPPVPTYTLTSSVPNVNEGATVRFNLATTNVADGTVLNYVLGGTGITVADTSVALAGTVTVNGGVAILDVTPTADLATEGAETLTMSITGTTATSSVVINDTSINPTPPTYTLTSSAPNVNEGATVRFNLATTNVADGTVLNYVLSGTGITVADTTVALAGTVTVNGGAAILDVTPTADLTTEGAETLTMSITGTTATSSVSINDTSLTPSLFVNVDLGTGSVTAAAGVAEAFVYDFSIVAGRATKAGDGEVTITGFDVTQDKLVFNDVGTGTVLTEAQFMALAGVSIAENPFALPPPGNTTIYFDPLAGVLGGVTLAGIADAALATIVVETLA
ncbi:hypothetical protein [Candidatus Accumulibacter vicinus]|uniref:Uncharacterized protein n=1 Tax=Candidatus Accumulibacter vicinus TaxID=2954382 RepID=A0A084XXF4_9PROT|nr:hypothetical protein [Candidatus Accumulibacter vicinus]KFB67148.1 MAG: hypothetical protein CAPSK01_003511 [Candidatus Accumulibacter vicinus]